MTIRKLFWAWDFDKEEKWLNEMSQKGLQLTKVKFCKYSFEEDRTTEFSYKLQYLDQLVTHAKSVQYIGFLKDMGIEHIDSYYRWIYLRKKTSEGNFDLYSDIDSKIKHMNKVLNLIGLIILINMININNGVRLIVAGVSDRRVSPIVMGMLILLFVLWLCYGFACILRKKRKLERESILRE